MQKGYKMCQRYFLFLMIPSETNHLRMYWTDLHEIFRIDTHGWAWSVRPPFHDHLWVIAMVTSFLLESAKIEKLTYPTFILCSGITQGWEDCKRDACLNTVDDLSAYDYKFGELRSSNPKDLQARLCRAGYAGICHTV